MRITYSTKSRVHGLGLLLVVYLSSVLSAPLIPFNKYSASVITNQDEFCAASLPGGFKFYGRDFTSFHVCSNGIISLGSRIDFVETAALPINNKPAIAPFWADVDTRPSGVDGSNRIYYETIPSFAPEAVTLNNIVNSVYNSTFNASRTYLATWDRVGAYDRRDAERNTFQAALLTDETMFYAIFNYPEGGINWITSDSVGFPQAGFNAGNDRKYFTLPYSRTNQIRNLIQESNIGIPGTWLFRVDLPVIENPPVRNETSQYSPTPRPMTATSANFASPSMPPMPSSPIQDETVLVYRNVDGKSSHLGAKISAFRDEVAISQPGCSPIRNAISDRCGKVFIVSTSPQGWELRQYFQYLGLVPNSNFGTALSLRDGWLVVTSTAPWIFGQPDASAVYGFQYVPSINRYVRRFRIAAPVSQEDLRFGHAVETVANFTFISAPGAHHPESDLMGAGVVLVYHYPKSIHMASGGKYHIVSSPSPRNYEGFGITIAAIDGTLAIATELDAVHLYYYGIEGVWFFQTITAPTLALDFGYSLFFSSGKLFIGAPMDSSIGTGNGAVRLYWRDTSGQFTEQAVFRPDSQSATGQGFGSAIHYNGMGRLVVSALQNYWCMTPGCDDKALVYVFSYDYNTNMWFQNDKFGYGASDGADDFGSSIAQTPFGIVVGAPEDSIAGDQRGAVYFVQY